MKLKTQLLILTIGLFYNAWAQEDRFNKKNIPDYSDSYKVTNLSINSSNSDYGVSYYSDEIIIFSSTRKDDENRSKRWSGNNQYFLNFYVGDSLVDGDVLHYRNIEGMANSKFHESNAVFNKERTKVYFTRNTFYENKKGLSTDRKLKLSIYIADVRPDGSWHNIVPFPYNSDEYSNGHPTLSLDGKILYYVSNMPGTLGRSDIFKCDITSEGTFTVPENLGANVNTPGKEMFPFIAPDGTLYFSSDGHGGLGKLDIFKTDSDELELAAVHNIGKPFNSSRDDFSFVLNNNMMEGYFSSNRPGGKGDDDIYYFNSTKMSREKPKEEVVVKPEKPCINTFEFIITNEEDGTPVDKAEIEIYDKSDLLIQKVETNASGTYSWDCPCNNKYDIKILKTYYLEEELSITATDIPDEKIETHISLIPEIKKRDGKIFIDIESIYFDFDDHRITKQAANQLDKVIAFMYKYPNTIIEGSSHTDSRGRDEYNLSLSTRRAKSTVAYIISNGSLSSARISAKGYGESSPVNHCIDGIKCTEEEHAINRRTEFEIVNPDVFK